MLGFCLAPWLYGPASDFFGRKTPLIIGLLTTLLGSCLCWFSPSINILFLGRFIQGLGGGGSALAIALLRDFAKGKQLAQYNTYLAIASIAIFTAAPIIGGTIQFFGHWRYNFTFLSFYSLFIRNYSSNFFKKSEKKA